jgi:hypothetical protein
MNDGGSALEKRPGIRLAIKEIRIESISKPLLRLRMMSVGARFGVQ